jgi:hypothetical protein
MYQNGITAPRTRLARPRAARKASSGSRANSGLKNAATDNSTPTIGPVTTTATAFRMSLMRMTLAVMLPNIKVLTK